MKSEGNGTESFSESAHLKLTMLAIQYCIVEMICRSALEGIVSLKSRRVLTEIYMNLVRREFA